METSKDRFPLVRKILKAIGLPAEAVDDIVERILDWLSVKETPATEFAATHFRLRDDFLSPAEINFFQVLRTAVGNRAIVLAKVNLADLFFVVTADQSQKRSLANRIDRKHVDFLVCELKSTRPIAGLELDDKSHERADRKLRDELVAGVFAAAGLPLLRIPVKASYSPQEIQGILTPYLQPLPGVEPASPVITKETADPEVAPAGTVPNCPKCGAAMLLRTAKTGPNIGGTFWGCPNFPRCRTMLPAGKKLDA